MPLECSSLLVASTIYCFSSCQDQTEASKNTNDERPKTYTIGEKNYSRSNRLTVTAPTRPTAHLDWLALVEGVLVAPFDNHSHQRAERIGDGVRQRSQGREAQLKRHCRHVRARGSKLVGHVRVRQVEHRGGEHGAVVVDTVDHQPVREGTDVKLLEQGRLGAAHL